MCNCSNGGATYIIGKIIAKDNLNIENLMRTFEKNFILQNYSTKFLDIAYKYSSPCIPCSPCLILRNLILKFKFCCIS